jgi:hypothetical protein
MELEKLKRKTCKCGCGKPIILKSWHKYDGIPKYKLGHNPLVNTKSRSKKLRLANLGKKHTPETLKKMSLAKKGKPSKKNRGLTTINKRIRSLSNYNEWRVNVFQRDKFTCSECGKSGVYLEAHHVIGLKEIIKKYNLKTIEEFMNCEQLWNLDNGKTVCFVCHKKIDKYRKQLNKKAKTNKIGD